MQWQEIREHYPQQWLLVEAIKAHSETNAQVVEQLAVVESFSNLVTAMKGYAQLIARPRIASCTFSIPVAKRWRLANEPGWEFEAHT